MGPKTKTFLMEIAVIISIIILGYLYQTKINRNEPTGIPITTEYIEFKCPDGQTYSMPRPTNVKSAKELEYYITGFCASISR